MQSFSQSTKEELLKNNKNKTCCQEAQEMGEMLFGGWILQETEGLENGDFYLIPKEMTENECCRKSLIRGAFLGGGTIIDPRKNYNLELVAPDEELSREMQKILREAGFDFRSVKRKSKYVLYLKNSETISDFLSYIGAFQSQMELLNIKIEKEIRNEFNRAANSEIANLEKTIHAAVAQIKAIEKIQKTMGLEKLPEDLREIARLRLAHKDLSLSELGALLNPPLTKSGVNHRLKKLMQYQED